MALSTVCSSCRPSAGLFRATRVFESRSQTIINLNTRRHLVPAPRWASLPPQPSILPTRAASFLHESAIPPSKRGTRDPVRTSTPRTGERNEKISTLAIDHSAGLPFATEESASPDYGSRTQSEEGKQKSSSRVRSRRRLLLISGIVLMPLIGRDVLETVVPGMLGVVIFTLGNVKAAWKWVKS